jgi:hypothetical protein
MNVDNFPSNLNDRIYWLRSTLIADADRLAHALEAHARDAQYPAHERAVYHRLGQAARDMHSSGQLELRKLVALGVANAA